MSSPRRKVSTLLDDALYRRAKLEAARQGKQVSEILGEALASYLGDSARGAGTSVAAQTWGAMRVDEALLRAVMAEEDWLGTRP